MHNLKALFRSLICINVSHGPRTKPWGIPYFTEEIWVKPILSNPTDTKQFKLN